MGTRRELEPGEDLQRLVDDHETVFAEFHADWCAPCAVLEEFIAEVLDDLDALVVKIDVEGNPELVEEHDVTANPTLLIIEDGEVVDRLEELPERPAFRERVSPWTSPGAEAHR